MKEKRSIGRGVEFLNKHLSTLLFSKNGEGHELLFRFLRVHRHRDKQLMINDRISDRAMLEKQMREAEQADLEKAAQSSP